MLRSTKAGQHSGQEGDALHDIHNHSPWAINKEKKNTSEVTSDL